MKKLILIGGGGHCRSVIDVIVTEGKYEIAGVLDQKAGEVLGFKVLGNDDLIAELKASGHHFLLTVGHMGNSSLREKLATRLAEHGASLATIISPSAHVSKWARIGEGSVIHHQALLNAEVEVGRHCIINTRALLEHDVKIADHAHVSTGAVLNGQVTVGARAFVGSGTIVKQSTRIGEGLIIGAGSVVTKDLSTPGTYYGVPAERKN